MLVQFILSISVVYFFLFQSEARLVVGQSFPGKATIFAVCRRSDLRKFIFTLVCFFPVVASLWLATSIFYGLSPLVSVSMWILFALILLTTSAIVRDFWKS